MQELTPEQLQEIDTKINAILAEYDAEIAIQSTLRIYKRPTQETQEESQQEPNAETEEGGNRVSEEPNQQEA